MNSKDYFKLNKQIQVLLLKGLSHQEIISQIEPTESVNKDQIRNYVLEHPDSLKFKNFLSFLKFNRAIFLVLYLIFSIMSLLVIGHIVDIFVFIVIQIGLSMSILFAVTMSPGVKGSLLLMFSGHCIMGYITFMNNHFPLFEKILFVIILFSMSFNILLSFFLYGKLKFSKI